MSELGPCEEWGGKRDKDGYGKTTFEGRSERAHRVVFFRANGYWPFICRHRCDNPPCIRADHLLDGTPQDNSNDAIERGRSVRGERVNTAKLTVANVEEMRLLYRNGSTQTALAMRFGVTQVMVSAIVRGKSWTHVDMTNVCPGSNRDRSGDRTRVRKASK